MPRTPTTRTPTTRFADYRYTSKPLVDVFDASSRGKKVAKLFLGEWLKVLEPRATNGRLNVHFRGGNGWVAAADVGPERMLEIFFLDVGQGDAILIQTPDDRRILIDGGPGDAAHQFIYQKYRLDKDDNYIDFDAVIATHSDADHADGLVPVLADEKIGVRAFYHNGLVPLLYKRAGTRVGGLCDRIKPGQTGLQGNMERLAQALATAQKNLPKVLAAMKKHKRPVAPHASTTFRCRRLDTATRLAEPLAGDTLDVQVLGPQTAGTPPTLPWFGSPGQTVNGNSVALMVTHGDFRILLAGDLNKRAMKDLVTRYRGQLAATVYKAAHHGSQDYDLGFLQQVQPQAAVISSGDNGQDKHGHPRAVLMGTITRYSTAKEPAVFCTELAQCYTPLRDAALAQFRNGTVQLYEKSIEGIVHLRSDGKQLVLGMVHGRRPPAQPDANTTWKWDLWPAEPAAPAPPAARGAAKRGAAARAVG